MAPSSKLGRGKPLKNQTKEVLQKIYRYFETEIARDPNSTVTAGQLVAHATGVSIYALRRLINEKTNVSVKTEPGTTRRRCKKNIVSNDYDAQAMRRIIHSFYTKDEEFPIMKDLYLILKGDLDYQGSLCTLRRHVTKLGFKWIEKADNNSILIEKHDVSSWPPGGLPPCAGWLRKPSLTDYYSSSIGCGSSRDPERKNSTMNWSQVETHMIKDFLRGNEPNAGTSFTDRWRVYRASNNPGRQRPTNAPRRADTRPQSFLDFMKRLRAIPVAATSIERQIRDAATGRVNPRTRSYSSINPVTNMYEINMSVKHFTPEELRVNVDVEGRCVTVSGVHTLRQIATDCWASRQCEMKFPIPDNVDLNVLKCDLTKNKYLIITAPVRYPSTTRYRAVPVQMEERGQDLRVARATNGEAAGGQGGMVPGRERGGMVPGRERGEMAPGLERGGMMPGLERGGMMPGLEQGGMMPGLEQGGMMPGLERGGMMPELEQDEMVPEREHDTNADAQPDTTCRSPMNAAPEHSQN